MRIEAELDLVHSDRLKTLQDRLNKPLPEVLGIAIDAALNELAPEPMPGKSSLYEALESIGFIGCIDDDARLAADYKQQLNFSPKVGTSQ
jgi:hypothetical protein